MRTPQVVTIALLSIFVFGVAHAAGTEASTATNQLVAQAEKPGAAQPQTSPTPEAYRPPKRTHAGPTMMGARAHRMQEKVAADISKAKAEGKDVTEAEHHKTEGDQALADGHFRVAVQHFRAAEKALHGMKAGAAPAPTAGAPK
jgi:hypothetical protein